MSFKGFPYNGSINQPDYSTPDGYFDALPDTILKNIKLSEGEEVEVKSILKCNSPFEVPNTYFDTLLDSVLTKAKERDKEQLGEALVNANQNVFEEPSASYFNTLPQNFLAEIHGIDTIAQNSPILAAGKVMPYSLENSYFMSLPQIIIDKVSDNQMSLALSDKSESQSATILNFESAPRTKRYFKFTLKHWSAAAAILIVAMVGFEFWQKLGLQNDVVSTASVNSGLPQTAIQKASKELDAISDANIQTYIQNNADEFDIQTIENAVAQNGNISSKDLLKSDDITDQDVEAYLSSGNF